ncbi:hypothetical protein [Candidatus Agathobaculum pullicola]|uniref:hypothetical protein n=1 Tax=Candidatus Agathobaculum pullicola TaxID=2838426 RepID=UPI003F8EE060
MKEQWKEWLRAAQRKIVPLAVKYRAVLIVLLAGVLLLASGGRGAQQTAASTDVTEEKTAFNLAAFEQTLCDKLAAVDGVGRVELMLSLEQSGEAVYAVNTRQTTGMDSSQSYESDLTILSDGSYGEKPVTVKNLLPTFRGAVVLCDGADNAQVRLAVTQAVGTVCGIGTDKVTVLKMSDAS